MQYNIYKDNNNINQEIDTLYGSDISFKGITYKCIIKKEKSNNIVFGLISNDDKYENKCNDTKISDLIIQNSNTLKVRIENIFQKKILININIIIGIIKCDFQINLEKVEQEKRIGKDRILDFDLDTLFQKLKNKEKNAEFFLIYPVYQIIEGYYFDLNNNKKYIIFSDAINTFITKNKKKYCFKIKTNLEILSKLNKMNINIKNVYIEEKKLLDEINDIHGYINDNQLTLNYVETETYNIEFNQKLFQYDKNYYPTDYSEYFADYFNIDNPDEIFIYENNDERKKIIRNFYFLSSVEGIKKYLITGPYASGKSITLLQISRLMNNVIYINLKTLKKNEENKTKCLKIILSEIRRLNIKVSDFNIYFDNFNFNQNVLGQLIDILEIVLRVSNQTIILILDQYKSANVASYKGFSLKIDYFIQNYRLKLVQCSSINDNEIRDLLLPTWFDFFSNPTRLEIKTQKYYFYYSKLYNPECKTYLQKLFGNKRKYMKMITDKNNLIENCLEEITTIIINQIKKFKKYEEDKNKLNFSDIDIEDILIFLYKNMNTFFEKNLLLNYVSICPLKFFVIEFKEDKFQISPLFPFLEHCLSKYIENSNCDDYFQKDKYKKLPFLTNSVKGEYFEFAVKKAINNKNILNIENIENFKSVRVYDISKMNIIVENSYQDIINKLNEEIYNIKTSNQNEEIIEVNDDKEQRNDHIYIKVNSKEKLNKNEAENIIKEKLMQYYSINENDNKLKNYKKVINRIEFNCLKDLNDYRYDEIEKRVKDKSQKIINLPNNTEKDKVYSIKISDVEQKSKKIFRGDENITIDQQNKYGDEMVDYAVLIGPKHEKIFIGFQIKCYSRHSKLESKFYTKSILRESLQQILINCKDLFNCTIKNWFYYLIFYYNQDDEIENQLEFYNQYQCINHDIEFLFYNPKEKKFLSSNYIAFKNLKLTDNANLDYFTYLNIKSNYEKVQLQYDKNINNVNIESYKKGYLNEFNQFIIDLKIYGKTAEEIIKNLCKLAHLKNLYYSKAEIVNEIKDPFLNKIYLYYKEENQGYYILIKRTKDGLEILDLQKKKQIKSVNFKKRVYILTTLESFHQKTSKDYIREAIANKIVEKDLEYKFNEFHNVEKK